MTGVDLAGLFFRFAAIGTLLVLTIRVLDGLHLRPFKYLFAGLNMGTCGYLVVSASILYETAPGFVLSMVPLTFPISWLFWMSAQSLFEDDFAIRPWHWAVLAATAGIGLLRFLTRDYLPDDINTLTPVINGIFNLMLVLHAGYVAWRGHDADLLEERRLFRSYFVVGAGLLISAVTIVELSFYAQGYNYASAELELLAAFSIWVIVTALSLQIFALRPDSLLAEVAKPVLIKARDAEDIAPADQALYQNLQKAMEQDEAFRIEGLTIGALAGRLGAPEHQLRKLINQAMGYKNFNAYLNQYRIAATKEKLSDLAQARTQVLTIALDAGYASLGPFNRAFKEATGQTPTEFRKQALEKAAP